MAISVEWDNPEQTILKITFTNAWTWRDIQQLRMEIQPMLESVEHPVVHFIADMRASDAVPTNPLANLRRFSDNPLDRSGIVVIVGMSVKANIIFNVFTGIYRLLAKRINYLTADTLEEARDIIAQEIASHNEQD